MDVLEVHRYEPGEAITMKLMKRSRGAMTAFPKTQWALSDRHLNVGGKPVPRCPMYSVRSP